MNETRQNNSKRIASGARGVRRCDPPSGQRQTGRLMLTLACLIFLSTARLQADTFETLNPISAESDLALYYGTFSDTRLLDILSSARTDYKPSHLLAATLSRPTGSDLSVLTFETEAQFVKHFGLMQHLEVNGLLIARWSGVFGLPIGLALGEGLSLAGTNPAMENQKRDWRNPFRTNEESRPLLNYIMVELEMGAAESDQPRVFMRVHHRSGVYGTYCPPTCGSNFIAYGVRLPVPSVTALFSPKRE